MIKLKYCKKLFLFSQTTSLIPSAINCKKGVHMIQTLYHVKEYKEDLIYPAICKAMETLGIAGDMRPDLKVVIKPNLIMAKSPDFPVTTHPLVIKAVVRWLKAQGVKNIVLAESSGGLYSGEHMKNIYQACS